MTTKGISELILGRNGELRPLSSLDLPARIALANHGVTLQRGSRVFTHEDAGKPSFRSMVESAYEHLSNALSGASEGPGDAAEVLEKALTQEALEATKEAEEARRARETVEQFEKEDRAAHRYRGSAHTKRDWSPLDVPEPWRPLLTELRDRYSVGIAFTLPVLLGVVASLVQGRAVVEVDGREDDLSLFFVGILPPGVGKTSILEAIQRPFLDLQRRLSSEHGDKASKRAFTLKVKKAELKAAEKALDRARNASDQQATDASEALCETLRRDVARLEEESAAPELLWTADANPPVLLKAAHQGGASIQRTPRMAVVSSEPAFLERLAGEYTDMQGLNEAWDGWSNGSLRASKQSDAIQTLPSGRRHVSVVVLSQPLSVIGRLFGGDQQSTTFGDGYQAGFNGRMAGGPARLKSSSKTESSASGLTARFVVLDGRKWSVWRQSDGRETESEKAKRLDASAAIWDMFASPPRSRNPRNERLIVRMECLEKLKARLADAVARNARTAAEKLVAANGPMVGFALQGGTELSPELARYAQKTARIFAVCAILECCSALGPSSDFGRSLTKGYLKNSLSLSSLSLAACAEIGISDQNGSMAPRPKRTAEVVMADIADRARAKAKTAPDAKLSFSFRTFQRICYGGTLRRPFDAPPARETLLQLRELGIVGVGPQFDYENDQTLTINDQFLPDEAEVARIRRETTLTLDDVVRREIELWRLELRESEPFSVEVAQDAPSDMPPEGEEFDPGDLF